MSHFLFIALQAYNSHEISTNHHLLTYVNIIHKLTLNICGPVWGWNEHIVLVMVSTPRTVRDVPMPPWHSHVNATVSRSALIAGIWRLS